MACKYANPIDDHENKCGFWCNLPFSLWETDCPNPDKCKCIQKTYLNKKRLFS